MSETAVERRLRHVESWAISLRGCRRPVDACSVCDAMLDSIKRELGEIRALLARCEGEK